MTARRRDLAELPAWPRGLSRDQAAAYVGVSPNTFEAEIRAGLWPKGSRRGKRVIWDRALLDAAFDAQSGLDASSGPSMAEDALRWARSH